MLKLRRGTDAERAGVTFASGEPVWTTDLKQLWMGDGTTAGGILVGGLTMDNLIYSLSDDSVTGTTLALAGYTFPDPGVITEQEGDKIFDVYVEGIKQFYKTTPTDEGQFTIDDVGGDIVFPVALDAQRVQVKAWIIW